MGRCFFFLLVEVVAGCNIMNDGVYGEPSDKNNPNGRVESADFDFLAVISDTNSFF